MLLLLLLVPILSLIFNECPLDSTSKNYGVSVNDKVCLNCYDYNKYINETYK
jgi:hypothetical protein